MNIIVAYNNINKSDPAMSTRLKENESTLSTLASELAELKKAVSGGIISPALRKDLANLRSDIDEKKAAISNMINNIRQLEQSLCQKNSLIKDLGSDLEDQTNLAETLSKKICEKDGLISALKNKMKVLIAAGKDIELANLNLEKQSKDKLKEAFSLNNRLEILNSKLVLLTKENSHLKNSVQSLNSKLQSTKSTLKETADNQVSEKQKYTQLVADSSFKNKEALTVIMQSHTRKISALISENQILKNKLAEKNALLKEKREQEKRFAQELVNKFNNIISESKVTEKTSSTYNSPLRSSTSEPRASLTNPIRTDLINDNSEEVILENEEEPASEFYDFTRGEVSAESIYPENRIEEIKGAINSAIEHGDSKQNILLSLLSCGYSKEEIDNVFSSILPD